MLASLGTNALHAEGLRTYSLLVIVDLSCISVTPAVTNGIPSVLLSDRSSSSVERSGNDANSGQLRDGAAFSALRMTSETPSTLLRF
jgi:hypothetical protein